MQKTLRGGWDVGPEEYKALGFTIGLPPGVYVPQTTEIKRLSDRYQRSDSSLVNLESKFCVQDRSALFRAGHCFTCYMDQLPQNITPEKIESIISAKLNRKLGLRGSSCHPHVVINPNGKFAFVYFEKAREADAFLEYKNTFEINGQTVRIRKSTNDQIAGVESAIPPERANSLMIITEVDEKVIRDFISVPIKNIEKPSIDGVPLGYYIIDLVDETLVDLWVLKLGHHFGTICRRCFPWKGQFPRFGNSTGQIDAVKFHNRATTTRYNVLAPNAADYTIADALNLDVGVTEMTTQLPSDGESKILRVFNVESRDDNSAEIIDDFRRECSEVARVERVYIDATWDNYFDSLPRPIVIEFSTHNDALNAQKAISGRMYRGHTVVTLLW